MIKIQEHLNRPDADDFLDGLALHLWNHFNKRLADDSDYYQSSLVKRLERLLALSKTQEYLVKYALSNQDTLNRHQDFFNYLQSNNCQKLKNLVVARPDRLLILRDEILNILRVQDIYEIVSGKVRQTIFGDLLIDDLFIYKNYRRSNICVDLINEMNLQRSFCPYCNSNRISVVPIKENDSEETINRAYLDIDHFYSKSKNPFFALSFYNLIPSCHACNSSEKGDKDFLLTTHTNPYHKSYNLSHRFKIDSDYLVNAATSDIVIRKLSEGDDFMDRDLHLSQRYKHTYLEELNGLIKHYLDYQHYRESPDYNTDYSDILLQRVPFTQNEILKKEAGKMFRDILK